MQLVFELPDGTVFAFEDRGDSVDLVSNVDLTQLGNEGNPTSNGVLSETSERSPTPGKTLLEHFFESEKSLNQK